MKTEELKKKSKADLEKELNEKELGLRDIRFGTASTKAKNVKGYNNLKKDIARIKTIIRSIN